MSREQHRIFVVVLVHADCTTALGKDEHQSSRQQQEGTGIPQMTDFCLCSHVCNGAWWQQLPTKGSRTQDEGRKETLLCVAPSLGTWDAPGDEVQCFRPAAFPEWCKDPEEGIKDMGHGSFSDKRMALCWVEHSLHTEVLGQS